MFNKTGTFITLTLVAVILVLSAEAITNFVKGRLVTERVTWTSGQVTYQETLVPFSAILPNLGQDAYRELRGAPAGCDSLRLFETWNGEPIWWFTGTSIQHRDGAWRLYSRVDGEAIRDMDPAEVREWTERSRQWIEQVTKAATPVVRTNFWS